jgi:hypothetical protein
VIEMDGIEIMNRFKKETIYEFSEAVPIFEDEIYFIFKVDIISIEANPSKTRLASLKRLIKKVEKSEMFISQLDIEPIAYMLKKDNKFHIEAINEKYESFIEKNGNNLLKEFLKDND